MQIRTGLMGAAFAALTFAVGHAAQQAPAPAPQAPQQGPPPAGRGQGRGRGVFPAMQRPPADPAVVERGRSIFSLNCSACHGADARGGQLGGPNLLRSQLVLADENGEQITPVVRNGRPDKGMPPFPQLADDDVKAIVEFVHSLTGASRGQGAPPTVDVPPPNILVGDAAAGQEYFAAKCSSCHSATGDLQGIATKIPDPKMLQDLWVSGGRAGGGGRGRGGPGPSGPAITATVTTSSGEKVEGRLIRVDDFDISVLQPDATVRTFRRNGENNPRVELHDPLEGHHTLLAEMTDKNMHDVTAYLVTLK